MKKSCYHCGDEIIGKPIEKDDKEFCCNGCLTVYEILNDNGLDQFYTFNAQSGVKPTTSNNNKYAALDVPEIFDGFISFQNDEFYIVTFFLPAIHCSSCIYLLENLQKLNSDIIKSEANFTARTLTLNVKKERKLSEVASLLESIGYKPELRKSSKEAASYDKKMLLQLGFAGFAFGSVMLWTFPEYLGLDESFESFRNFSAYLSLAISIPVLLFSARSYLVSAYHAVRTQQLNLDIPIALGILVLFFKSAVTVLQGEGSGYIDSFTGFVFFLMIGKWFQSRTYKTMSFDNDPKAYFPLGVHRISEGSEEIVKISEIKEQDQLHIFNEEIIPCDGALKSDKAVIDTSFITGESALVNLKKGDRIYAGSKLIGSSIFIDVLTTTDQSKFASIWNQANEKTQSLIQNRENLLSKYFLIIVGIVSTVAGITWYFIDPSEVISIVTAVLVVACPCALALSFPFVFGNALRKLGRNGLYFRNSSEIQKLSSIDHIVFDKTGTLTKDRIEGVKYEGIELSEELLAGALELTRQSMHPYSKSIANYLSEISGKVTPLEDYQEISGMGVQGKLDDQRVIKVGSASFVGAKERSESGSFIALDNEVLGFFRFESTLREGVLTALQSLGKHYKITLLSGDKAIDAPLFEGLDGQMELNFNLSPNEKKQMIERFKINGDHVLFVGDGLNDSEALNAADLGISVAEDEFRFTPKCDAIIQGEAIYKLPQLLKFGSFTKSALQICLTFSLIYNLVGISFAVLGYVTPLFAAILMPLSSISIVFLSTALIQFRSV
jgi:Cu+-exporting ATPase